MMKKTSKLIAALLAVVMIIGLMPIYAGATTPTSGTCGTNVTWKVENNVLTFSGKGAIKDYSLTITPPYANKDLNYTSIVIEEGITRIGAYSLADYNAFSAQFLGTGSACHF